MNRPASFVFALVLLASALILGTASASKPKVESKITYSNEAGVGVFIHTGKVKSDVNKCVKARTVELRGETFDKPFAIEETDADGKYRFEQEQDGIAQDYYTVVLKKETQNAICKADESPHKPLD